MKDYLECVEFREEPQHKTEVETKKRIEGAAAERLSKRKN